jgi:hypothetical protein
MRLTEIALRIEPGHIMPLGIPPLLQLRIIICDVEPVIVIIIRKQPN